MMLKRGVSKAQTENILKTVKDGQSSKDATLQQGAIIFLTSWQLEARN